MHKKYFLFLISINNLSFQPNGKYNNFSEEKKKKKQQQQQKKVHE